MIVLNVNKSETKLIIADTINSLRGTRARIPVHWQNNYDVYKNGSTTHRTGIRPEIFSIKITEYPTQIQDQSF